ncbi:MAG TPA: hypothetical protein VD840_04380 [Sinorhizobium sp.]|nr:hypothetical protein [Sinorhizobium sp.]
MELEGRRREDSTEICEIFADFAFNEAEPTYSVGAGKGTAAKELIISAA